MSKDHQKHTKIKRPTLGHYGRNEFAILGTPCGEIKKIAQSISENLSKKYKIAYIDADHKSGEDPGNVLGSGLEFGYQMACTDKIEFHRFDVRQKMDDFQIKSFFNGQDLILINGNHSLGARQIIVMDDRKPLEKKLERLTDVALILYQNRESEVPEYIKSHVVDFEQIPKLKVDDQHGISDLIQRELELAIPKVNGLVLAGGKSIRMERDKTLINYHGKSQRNHMFDLLSEVTDKVFFSIREDQEDYFEGSPTVKDTFIGLGPYGAILSAMMKEPDRAWLVTASDQPFLTKEVLKILIEKRNLSKVATAFYNPETDFPEPLVTLWEPRAYPIMLQYLSLGYSCPRKVLINSDIELVKLEDPTVLGNVNTPEEYRNAKEKLKI